MLQAVLENRIDLPFKQQHVSADSYSMNSICVREPLSYTCIQIIDTLNNNDVMSIMRRDHIVHYTVMYIICEISQ